MDVLLGHLLRPRIACRIRAEYWTLGLRRRSISSVSFENAEYFRNSLRILMCAVIGRNNVLALSAFQVRAPIRHHTVARIRRIAAAAVADNGVEGNARSHGQSVHGVNESAFWRQTVHAVGAAHWF